MAGKKRSDEVANVAEFNITHPKKICFPKEKITKLDVVQYYVAGTPRILPCLKKHPLNAERCPDGIRGECF